MQINVARIAEIIGNTESTATSVIIALFSLAALYLIIRGNGETISLVLENSNILGKIAVLLVFIIGGFYYSIYTTSGPTVFFLTLLFSLIAMSVVMDKVELQKRTMLSENN